jgi:hypothetical protein
MKTRLKIPAIIIAVLLVAGFAFWLKFRHPYANRYFTPEMQAKYSTVESVLDAMREGWRYDTDSRAQLMNEAYGFNLARRYRSGKPFSEAMGQIKTLSYSRDRKMAFVETSDSGCFFINRQGRWVFYPETPWIGLLEIMHSK